MANEDRKLAARKELARRELARRKKTRLRGSITGSGARPRDDTKKVEQLDQSFLEDIGDAIWKEKYQLAGGAAGTALLPGPVGRTIGAGIGGAAGKLFEKVIPDTIDAFRKGGSGNPVYNMLRSISTPEHVEATKKAFKQEALGQVIGESTGAVISGIAKGGYTKKKMIPGLSRVESKLSQAAKNIPNEAINEAAERLARHKGVFFTAAQATDSRGLDTLESFIENSFIGAGRLQMQKDVIQPAALKQFGRQIADGYWSVASRRLASDDLAGLMVKTLRGSDEAWRDMSRQMYRGMDDIIETIGKPVTESVPINKASLTDLMGSQQRQTANIVNLQPAKERAIKNIKMAAAGHGFGSSPQVEATIKKIMDLPDTAGFMDAHTAQSFLKEEGRLLEAGLRAKLPRVNKVLKESITEIDDQMGRAAKAHSEELYDAWRAADAHVKLGYETFGNDFVKSVVRMAESGENALAIARKTFAPGNIAGIKKMKKVLPDDVYNTMKATWFEDVLKIDEIDPGKTLSNAIKRFDDATLKEITESPRHLRDLKDLATASEIIKKSTGGGGSILAPLAQAGALVSTITQPSQAIKRGAGSILAGPAMMGVILSHETPTKWLVKGVKDPDRMAVYIKQAIASATKIHLANERQKQQRNNPRKVVKRPKPNLGSL